MSIINNQPNIEELRIHQGKNEIIYEENPLYSYILSDLSLYNIPLSELSVSFLNDWLKEHDFSLKEEEEIVKVYTDGTYYVINHNYIETRVNDVKNGPLIRWYDNVITHYYFYVNGEKDGLETQRFNNGMLQHLKQWNRGTLVGEQRMYNEDGTLRLIQRYENGELIEYENYNHGIFLSERSKIIN